MKKKLFSVIMCVLMVMCFMPTAAFATVTADTLQTSLNAAAAEGAASTEVTISTDISVETLTIPKDVTLKFANGGKLTVSGTLIVNGTLDMSYEGSTSATGTTLIIGDTAVFNISGTGTVKSGRVGFSDIEQKGTMTLSAGAKYIMPYPTDNENFSEVVYLGGESDAGAWGKITSGAIVSEANTDNDPTSGFTYTIHGNVEAGISNGTPFAITGKDKFVVASGSTLTATNFGLSLATNTKSSNETPLVVQAGGMLEVGDTADITNTMTAINFSNALNYMESGAILKPTKDITLSANFVISNGNKVILNLNNKTINTSGSGYFLISHGELDVTGTGVISYSGTGYAIKLVGSKTSTDANYSILLLDENVTLNSNAYCVMVSPYVQESDGVSNYGVVATIKGKITTKHGLYINGQLKETEGNVTTWNITKTAQITGETSGIYAAGYANWNLAGSINAPHALSLKSGTFNITGGTYTSTGTFADPAAASGNGSEPTGAAISITSNDSYARKVELTVTGGTFTSTNGYALYEGIAFNSTKNKYAAEASYATLSISGGTFTGNAEKGAVNISKATNKKVITGGTFSSDPTAYVKDGYVATKNNDGTYTVSKKVVYGGGSGGSGSSSSSSASSGSSAVVNTTETKTDSSAAGTTTTTTVPETKATVKAETKTAADGTKTTTATVDTAVATQIVEKAVENKSEEVVVTTATTPVTETAAGTTTEVAIPAETVSQIAEKTTAAVTIETEAAEVSLDEKAVEAVAEQAGETGSVKLVVETKAQDANKVEVELKLETSNGTVSDFKGGNISVTVKLNAALAAKPVTCVYIDDNGNYHKVAGHKNADGTYTFTTKHFSTYAIMAVEEADAVIATQTENVTKLVNDLSLKARSSKTKKGNIKVTLTVDADEIQAIEDLGYTVKYKFYRSTKKSSAYKAKIEGKGKTYTNTSGKKGTKYYYKARVMVYDTEGTLIAKTALKQCKYASRIK